uniref:SWIM-type domain-containing protein n=1 Tax=Lactuca sativa TaxID=4236 RepID=A0A9R1V0F9_LACSA|nr:hypothetical protein LSAT_V11C700368450 [Lactuca sativa]
MNLKLKDVKRRRTSSKKNRCPAVSKFKNLRCSLMFYIYVFVEDHNHELVAQDQLHLLRINRTNDFLDESFIHKVGACNIGASKAYNLVSSMKGGFNSMGGTAVDFKNFQRDLNSKIGVKDSQMVVDIDKQKLLFSNFSFEVQKDVDDHFNGLFWVDNTSKANYKEFGDVLSFDATYQTKKVDYHKRCVSFGAGLLARETADGYVWLLEEFRKTFVKPPMMIVTNQDSSMKKYHSLCMWHITQKLEEKIPIDVYNHPDFQNTFLYYIGSSISWSTMLDKFHLKENDWLKTVFKIRDSWIPAFMRDHELSGLMQTTSRLESMNCAFSHFLHHKSNLVKFMMSFDKLYKFVLYCVQESVVIEDESEVYVLRDKKKKIFLLIVLILVTRRGDSISISCSCMLFVQEGLLCRHIFFILNMKAKHECLIQDTYGILRLSINKIANNEDELAKYIKQLHEVDSVHSEKIIGAAIPDVINIHNPQGIRNRGWANGKRIKSTTEKAIETSKKGSRLCGFWHKPNHNARSCILRLKKSDLESESINTYIYNFLHPHLYVYIPPLFSSTLFASLSPSSFSSLFASSSFIKFISSSF